MKRTIIFLAAAAMLASAGCKEKNHIHPWGPDIESGAPDKLTVLDTEGTPGGGIITFVLPSNSDVQYVKAVYHLSDGTRMEARSSRYSSTVEVEGFGDTQAHTVTLSCVDFQENEGQSVETTVTPLTPPVMTVYESLVLSDTFGGVAVDYENEAKSSVAIHVQTLNSQGYIDEPHVQYTMSEKGRFYVRGYGAGEREFGAYVTDRWGNRSPVMTETINPLPESRLNKGLFRNYFLMNDTELNAWGGSIEQLWDGNFGSANFAHSEGGTEFPCTFTFDLGVTARLSRFKYYQIFQQEHAYQRGNPKTWEVWGRTDTPNRSGSWDGWTKLMDCESFKPSGLPVGEITAEDWEFIQEGEDFVFPVDTPVRYLRFNIIENWGGDDFIHLCELTFWGTVVD